MSKASLIDGMVSLTKERLGVCVRERVKELTPREVKFEIDEDGGEVVDGVCVGRAYMLMSGESGLADFLNFSEYCFDYRHRTIRIRDILDDWDPQRLIQEAIDGGNVWDMMGDPEDIAADVMDSVGSGDFGFASVDDLVEFVSSPDFVDGAVDHNEVSEAREYVAETDASDLDHNRLARAVFRTFVNAALGLTNVNGVTFTQCFPQEWDYVATLFAMIDGLEDFAGKVLFDHFARSVENMESEITYLFYTPYNY